MIPEPSTPGTEMFTISTSQVLLTLVTELDYAVEQTYTLTLGVADTGSGLTGSLIIRVSLIESSRYMLNLDRRPCHKGKYFRIIHLNRLQN